MTTKKQKTTERRFLSCTGQRLYSAILILIVILSNVNILTAQIGEIKEVGEKYQLKEVVVLSRHNIRAPLSGKNSVLGKVTSHEWTDWSANASELTLRGGVLETMMGQYFRKWLEAEGLFEEGQCPTVDDVYIYANSMQRTIATAEYFQAGFMPTCNHNFFHRYTPSKMDPVFFPRLTKVNDGFIKQALKEINELGGEKSVVALTQSLKPSFDLLYKVLDMKNAPISTEADFCKLTDYNTQLLFEQGKEPNLKGSLKLGTQIADALILQYFEVADERKAAFGNELTQEDWESISKIKDVYGDILFSAPIVAANVAHPLLVYINDELNARNRKFTYLVGHDSNISSITSALGIEEYSLPQTIEKKTPIGSKLVFEKWEDPSTNIEYISINMIYQSTDQLRNLIPLDLKNPPVKFQLKLSGLEANELGFYKFEDVIARFASAISVYYTIDSLDSSN